MRWFRLLFAMIQAKFKPKMKLTDTNVKTIRVWITDIDVSVMNHAAIMTVFETGRVDFMVRSNFFKAASGKKWFFPNQAIGVQFYRPLKMFQKAMLYTRVAYVDEKMFYIEQKLMRNGKPVASLLANAMVKQGRETIPPIEIVKALDQDIHDIPKIDEDLVTAFEQKNDIMTRRIITDWEI